MTHVRGDRILITSLRKRSLKRGLRTQYSNLMRLSRWRTGGLATLQMPSLWLSAGGGYLRWNGCENWGILLSSARSCNISRSPLNQNNLFRLISSKSSCLREWMFDQQVNGLWISEPKCNWFVMIIQKNFLEKFILVGKKRCNFPRKFLRMASGDFWSGDKGFPCRFDGNPRIPYENERIFF